MSSLKNIQAKMEKMEKLEQEIQNTKNEIHKALGERLVQSLEIDYELLSSKKDIEAIADLISENTPKDLFSDSKEEPSNSNDNSNHNNDTNDNKDSNNNNEKSY